MNDPLGHINAAGGPGGLKPTFGPGQGPGKAPLAGPNGKIFLDELKGQIAEVNRLQGEAEIAAEDLVAGRRDDLEGVMIATEKADTAFKMLLAVRNKMLDAYDEVKNLRV
ncbi:MAG: flagellar hook-basal body complex protein FliE [Phycisphaerales bacterium]|jgi:flagellar hook-basal body complex protein FliE|nr:flagellar hook-basal body complex protein FliE [Phycisphaerales bacterium]